MYQVLYSFVENAIIIDDSDKTLDKINSSIHFSTWKTLVSS